MDLSASRSDLHQGRASGASSGGRVPPVKGRLFGSAPFEREDDIADAEGRLCRSELVNVLIVHAHYEPASFTAAMRDKAVAEFTAQGHVVQVSDLYEMNFNPVARKSDFLAPSDPDYTVYSLEQRHGLKAGTLAGDIAAEVEKLRWADLLVLSFPVFWFSTPAIMKGWIDRILLSGLAFGGKRFYDRGGLRGKRALIAATIGSRDHMFGTHAVHGPLETMFSHLLRGTLGYVGFDVLPPYVAWHVPYITTEQREEILEDYRRYLGRLDIVEPLAMPMLDSFDETMRPKVVADPASDS
jgi:NAD(P)H dehydrogenase (quinone)